MLLCCLVCSINDNEKPSNIFFLKSTNINWANIKCNIFWPHKKVKQKQHQSDCKHNKKLIYVTDQQVQSLNICFVKCSNKASAYQLRCGKLQRKYHKYKYIFNLLKIICWERNEKKNRIVILWLKHWKTLCFVFLFPNQNYTQVFLFFVCCSFIYLKQAKVEDNCNK